MAIKRWREYEKKAKNEMRFVNKSLNKILKRKDLCGDEIDAIKLVRDFVFGYKFINEAVLEKLISLYQLNDIAFP